MATGNPETAPRSGPISGLGHPPARVGQFLGIPLPWPAVLDNNSDAAPDRERKFLEAIIDWTVRPSDKQLKWLWGIAERLSAMEVAESG